jgi:hypothetical protein
MSKENLGQEPAFPTDLDTFNQTGINKRFYAACAAMQGMISTHANPNASHPMYDSNEDITNVVRACYAYADELLKQEES